MRYTYFVEIETDTQMERKILNNKWLHINDAIANKKIIMCTKITEFRSLGQILYKLKCRWETQVEEMAQVLHKAMKKVNK